MNQNEDVKKIKKGYIIVCIVSLLIILIFSLFIVNMLDFKFSISSNNNFFIANIFFGVIAIAIIFTVMFINYFNLKASYKNIENSSKSFIKFYLKETSKVIMVILIILLPFYLILVLPFSYLGEIESNFFNSINSQTTPDELISKMKFSFFKINFIPILVIIIMIITLIIIYKKQRKDEQKKNEKTNAIQISDSKLEKSVFSNFRDILLAISNNSLENVKNLMSDELYSNYKKIVLDLVKKNKRQIYKDINFVDLKVVKNEKIENNLNIEVILTLNMINLEVENTVSKKFIDISSVPKKYQYKLRFIGNYSNYCSNCGAKIDILKTTKCEVCQKEIKLSNYILTYVEELN